jgi:hypothetical protein
MQIKAGSTFLRTNNGWWRPDGVSNPICVHLGASASYLRLHFLNAANKHDAGRGRQTAQIRPTSKRPRTRVK